MSWRDYEKAKNCIAEIADGTGDSTHVSIVLDYLREWGDNECAHVLEDDLLLVFAARLAETGDEAAQAYVQWFITDGHSKTRWYA